MTGNINITYLPVPCLKTVTIGVYIQRALNASESSANAILPYVLRGGCRLYGDMEQISRRLEELYGASLSAGVTKMGDNQTLRFEVETIADKYAANGERLVSELLKLLMSVIFEPITENGAFKADIVAIEKNNAKDRIRFAMNDKASYATQRCTEEMCAGERYAVPQLGTPEGIDAITPASLYEHYKKIITSSVIDIYVCGDADKTELDAVVAAVTDGMSFTASQISATPLHENGGVKNVTERMDVTQGKLSMGFTTGIKPTDSDYIALMVANSIFGAGAHSKLFNNVREKLSLAYYASSRLVKAKGLLMVSAGIEFENFQRAYDEILAQLETVRRGDITDTEFNSSVMSLVNGLESIKDDAAQLHAFAEAERVNGTGRTVDEVKDAILRVSAEDAVRAAQGIKLDTVYFLTGKEENR